MLETLNQDEIANRVKAINLTRTRLAAMAGLTPSTVCRGPQRIRTNSTVLSTLTAEELRLLRHLIALHPDEAMAALCPERKTA